jgi:uncharacterized protein YndB with AHSA1/START domain
MRILLTVLKYLALLVLSLLVIGFFLPAKYAASRSIVVNAPAEKVFGLVESPKEWKRWSAWNARDPNMAITYSGPEKGVGAKWAWKSASQGDGEMEYTAAEPGRKLVYSLKIPDMGAPSVGEMTFTPEANATRVNWSMHGEMGSNPIQKWFGLFMDKLVGPDFEAGLKSLKAVAEK